MKTKTALLASHLAILSLGLISARAQNTAFTYQGVLKTFDDPASGLYDFKFRLFDAVTAGNRVPNSTTEVSANAVPVSNGLFTTRLDFGSAPFDGSRRWLEMDVRTNTASANFVTLSPRTELTPTPYAMYATKAGSVTNGSITAAQLAAPAAAPGQVLSYNGSGLVWQNPPAANSWGLSGNTGVTGANFLGTIDNRPLELKVNNVRALRLEPNGSSPNIIGGSGANTVGPGVVGATIGGGGWPSFSWPDPGAPNSVMNHYGTVAGGAGNRAEGSHSTIGGGEGNSALGLRCTVSGGGNNQASGDHATVSGGLRNTSGYQATVGGGSDNRADGVRCTVAGGGNNLAQSYDSTVSGGYGNTANGFQSTVPGGAANAASGDFSFAAGRRAKALHAGSFVWGDATDADVTSTAPNQFLIRASGGVNVQGTLTTSVLTITGGADLAEPFQMSAGNIAKGAVVIIDEANPGKLKLSERAYDTRVAGIVSGANGIKPGISLTQEGVLDAGENVALTGRVYVQADASGQPIKPGDLLTTSDVPGHAMRAVDPAKATGAVLGKAMTGLDEGKGMVLVLVSLQ